MSIKNPGAGMMASSPRPKKRPAGMKNPAEMKSSMRPKTRSDYETEKDVEAAAKGYKAGGKLKMVSKGGKKVPAFAADGVGKMAMGGMCRGMGAASKGGKYKA